MSTRRAIGTVGALWGTAGVFALLVFAIWRLAPKAQAAYDMGLTAGQWGIAVAVCVFMAYAEGYRGFQKRFSPRTAARVRYLRDRPNGLRTLQDFAGPAHIVFGTDHAILPAKYQSLKMRELMRYKGFDEAERLGVERENALRLFPRLLEVL